MPVPFASGGPAGGFLLPVVALAYWVPYALRARTLARQGRPVPAWRRACFAAGLIVLAVALSGPVDVLAGDLLIAHMIEHLMIADGGALLIVLGLTGPVLQPILRFRWVERLRFLAYPPVAIALWAGNFYLWHLPALYEGALRHDGIHALEHATFFILGVNLWLPLFGPLPMPAWFGNAAKLVYIIVVRLAGAVLGNVLLWSGTVFYPYYEPGAASYGISALQDQSVAGAVMMTWESLFTLGLFCWLFLKSARESDERQELLDYAAAHDLALSGERAARAVAAGRGEELRRRLVAAHAAEEEAAGSGVGSAPGGKLGS